MVLLMNLTENIKELCHRWLPKAALYRIKAFAAGKLFINQLCAGFLLIKIKNKHLLTFYCILKIIFYKNLLSGEIYDNI
jgi:hypothetical protein